MIKEPYILYIEDEFSIFEVVSQALQFSGYNNVMSALSGGHGLAMIRDHKPDLVLLDLMMPGINGWEVYRQMKTDAQLLDIPVIVITANIPEHDRIICDDLPPTDDYITKPFELRRLITSVEKVLHKKNSTLPNSIMQ